MIQGQQWADGLHSDPAFQQIYEEEASKSELWLQLVEARQAAGLTQQQVAERMGISQSQIARIGKAAMTPIRSVHSGAISRR